MMWNKEQVIIRFRMMMNEGKIERNNKPQRNHTPTTQMRSSYSATATTTTPHYSHHLYHMRNASKHHIHHHHRLMRLFRVFWLTMVLWSEPKVVVDGLPLVPTTQNAIILFPVINDGVDARRFLSPAIILPNEQLSGESSSREEENVQETTGSSGSTDLSWLETSPRTKKGLSYLSKYYSTAILNNVNLNGGDAPSKSVNANQFFGVGGGRSSGTRNSSEQRFPTIRRKLSFYPPVTSHSTFITPWSRFVARPTTMRLRWGK